MIKSVVSFVDLMGKFPNEDAARKHFEKLRWNGKPTCPKCNSDTKQYERTRNGRIGFYICRICNFEYSVRTGTVFQRSHIPLHKWFYALYQVHNSRKGISSIKLSKDLGISQASTWYMGHRVRELMLNNGLNVLKGEVEADEAYFGGKEKNKPASKKLKLGRGPVGKIPVLGMRERGGNVVGVVIKDTSAKTIQDELNKNIDKDATLYTDEHKSYQGNKFKHKTVNHSVKQYVDGKAHTNSIESYWALLKRGHYGIFHNLSKKHLQRYVDEFAYRLNDGKADQDSMEVINSLLTKSVGKRLTYKPLKGTLTE